MPIPFAAKFPSSDGTHAIVVEDDGRVGYAYLLDADGRISGDVWLYNRNPAPQEPEWSDPEKAPFANPATFVRTDESFSLPASAEDISVEWINEGIACVARILIHRVLAAVLKDGDKPGWATLAKNDGPLARVLRQ